MRWMTKKGKVGNEGKKDQEGQNDGVREEEGRGRGKGDWGKLKDGAKRMKTLEYKCRERGWLTRRKGLWRQFKS